MACTARVLLVSDGSSKPEFITQKLHHRGIESFLAQSADEALVLAGNHQPDIVIIDGAMEGSAAELGQALKSAEPTHHIPVVVFGEESAISADDKMYASVDQFWPLASTDGEIHTRLNALVRLTTMKAELERRAQTALRYGIKDMPTVEPPSEVEDATVLLLSSRRDSLAELEQVLGGGSRIEICNTPFEALERLSGRDYDAVIVSLGDENGIVLEFCGDVRNNTRLHTVPLLLVVEPETFEDPEEPFRQGASDVLHRPLRPEEFRARLKTLVKQRRYQTAMQRTYREVVHIATSDSLTGLFNRGYLHEHLALQITDAKRHNKHLTIGFFDIEDIAEINKEHGYAGGDRLLRQIGRLISTLLRGEDLAARYSGNEFCVVLPETEAGEAEVALHRIAGVIGNTDFALTDLSDAVNAKLRVGRAHLEEDDTPESFIARARADLL